MAQTQEHLIDKESSHILEKNITLTSISASRRNLGKWIRERECSGFEPYDLLNSPYLSGAWAKWRPLSILILQAGRRFAGGRTRQLLRVPSSTNPKALGLLLSAYCDLSHCGEDWEQEVRYLKAELIRLRSSNEELFCWGYDWDFYSLRGPVMPAFSPNSVATCFCASALLDVAETFGDSDAQFIAESAGEFFIRRLNRSVDLQGQVCFSYTPKNRTVIYNSSALVGSFLARLGQKTGNDEYLQLSKRIMSFLAGAQSPDGSWLYGAKRRQAWIDHFHTGYNLCALLEYAHFTGDESFEPALLRGYRFYQQKFFGQNGAPKYFHNSLYPIDIHSCSQAILTSCAFSDRDPFALDSAFGSARWAIENMQAPEGYFYFQRHRFWTNRTPYMRWGQAWMFRALARLELTVRGQRSAG